MNIHFTSDFLTRDERHVAHRIGESKTPWHKPLYGVISPITSLLTNIQ